MGRSRCVRSSAACLGRSRLHRTQRNRAFAGACIQHTSCLTVRSCSRDASGFIGLNAAQSLCQRRSCLPPLNGRCAPWIAASGFQIVRKTRGKTAKAVYRIHKVDKTASSFYNYVGFFLGLT